MFTSVAQANEAVIERIRNARPHWLDVKPAGALIGALNQNKTLLHAGPPMRWQAMTGPMKGACIGACLFEGWAQDEKLPMRCWKAAKLPLFHAITLTPWGQWAALLRRTCRCWWWKISLKATAPIAT